MGLLVWTPTPSTSLHLVVQSIWGCLFWDVAGTRHPFLTPANTLDLLIITSHRGWFAFSFVVLVSCLLPALFCFTNKERNAKLLPPSGAHPAAPARGLCRLFHRGSLPEAPRDLAFVFHFSPSLCPDTSVLPHTKGRCCCFFSCLAADCLPSVNYVSVRDLSTTDFCTLWILVLCPCQSFAAFSIPHSCS